MKMLTQIIYDLQKNKKLSIYTDPDGGSSSVTQNSGGTFSSINGPGGGMVKFYPSGAKETMTYSISKLTDMVPSLPADNITYLSFTTGFPTSQNYSLLNDNVMYKAYVYDASKIILGTVPNIVSLMYSAVSEPTLLQQFGVVCKELYYDEKYFEVKSSIGKDNNYALRSCSTLGQISNNKSQYKYTTYATGQVLCGWAGYSGGTDDAYVNGIQYISRGYDIDYYNQTIVPIEVFSHIDSTQLAPVQLPITVTFGDGGFTARSFTTAIDSYTEYDYLYYGEDPLQLKVVVDTVLTGESFINLNNFLVLAHIKNNQFQKVIIANAGNAVYSCSYSEHDTNNYETVDLDNATFYRLTSTAKARQEDCLATNVAGTNVIYPCSNGLGTQNGLSTIMAYMKTLDRNRIIETAPLLDEGDMSNYYTKVGIDIQSLTDVIAAQEGSFHILNNVIGVYVKQERLERSVTKCVPMGRNMSHRTIYSERVGEIKQDFDSKEYIGGALPLKTETIPTFPARATAGNGDIPQNVGYGNAIYYDESDVQTVADNFAAMNEKLSHISVSFKGPATIEDLESALTENFILDSASQDIGRNMTTFNCRAVIFN